jgi:pimeloyl-ACP methyl ester carboxylesterase
VTPKARPATVRSNAARLFIAALVAAALCTVGLVHADPVALKTTELGHGPTVVFVPGVGASRNDWLPTARKLIGRYRIVLVDLPGHGESPMPDALTFATVGEALDAVLARQNADSTIVVGHQMGGRAALAALAAHPGHARGLMLIDVPVGTPLPIDDQQKKQFLDFMDQNYEQVADRMFGNMGRDSTQSKAIYTVFGQTPPAVVKAYIREAFYSDGNKDAKSLKVPVQFLFTSRAWKAGRTSGAIFKQFGWEDTSAAAVRIPDSGYWVMKDQADTLAAMISAFATARIAAKK